MEYIIENMKPTDWTQVSGIYLEGILTKIATFQNDVPSYEDWDVSHSAKCRLIARGDNMVLGWVAISPVSSRCVYAGVAEVSIYIKSAYKGHGIGKALLNELVKQSELEGYWTLQSGIIKENIASRELHKKCGFMEIGFRERVGQMSSGIWHDVVLMERRSKTIG